MPVRRFWAWDGKQPGFCGIGTVSHGGGGETNSHYAWALAAAGVALCRAEAGAIKDKARKWAAEAADGIRTAFPVPISGVLTAAPAANSLINTL
jgi:hypothetical protein